MTDVPVFVVYWSGDDDCGGRNDGPISVHTDKDEAVEAARVSAEAEAAKRRSEREAYNASENPVGGLWSPKELERIVVNKWNEHRQGDGVLVYWDVYGERCGCLVTELILA